MHDFAQLGILLAGRAAPDRKHALDAGIEQAFAQHALPDHSGCAEQDDFHDFRRLFPRYSTGRAVSPRKPCSAATTCAPSPMAPPTRLTEPERTSPTANTPGTDVSSAEANCPSACLAMRAGHHEAAAIDHDAAAIEPAGGGIGADEQEQVADIEAAVFTGQPAAPAHPLERTVRRAFERHHLGVENQFDVRRRLDAFNQVARHAGTEAAAADHQMDLAGMTRQEHRGLAGGIAAAHQHDVLIRTEPRLDRRGPIPDAAALEAGEVFDLGTPIARTARHHHGPRAQHFAVIELQPESAIGAGAIERRHRHRDHASRRRISAPG